MTDDERNRLEIEMVHALRQRVMARLAGSSKANAAAIVRSAFDRHLTGIKRRQARARTMRARSAKDFMARAV